MICVRQNGMPTGWACIPNWYKTKTEPVEGEMAVVV
ncbi:MAG: hypothetical protein RL750_217, partial [Bacteroidota bacterium]